MIEFKRGFFAVRPYSTCDEYLRRVTVIPLGFWRIQFTHQGYCGICLGWTLQTVRENAEAGTVAPSWHRAQLRMIEVHSKDIYLTKKVKK